jgi:hypothetical protein
MELKELKDQLKFKQMEINEKAREAVKARKE